MARNTNNLTPGDDGGSSAAGKQPIAPVLARAMTMLSLLPVKPPGLTAQQLRDALSNVDDGFGVHTRTVERNLSDLSAYFPITCDEDTEPYRWHWLPNAGTQMQQMTQRVAAERTRLSPTPGGESALSWRPAEDYAESLRVPVDEVIYDISQGHLNGVLLHGRWYVLDLVTLDMDPDRPERAHLRISARRDGDRLTAGSGILDLALTYDGDAISAAITPVMSNSNGQPPEWLPVKLGGTTFEVDRTLQGDLLGALLVWQVEVELGDLLRQLSPHEPA